MSPRRLKRNRKNAPFHAEIQKLMEDYLTEKGWKKGCESWLITNPKIGGSRRDDDVICLSLSKAARLQKKWDAWENNA
jgi:hypothetical protein